MRHCVCHVLKLKTKKEVTLVDVLRTSQCVWILHYYSKHDAVMFRSFSCCCWLMITIKVIVPIIVISVLLSLLFHICIFIPILMFSRSNVLFLIQFLRTNSIFIQQ